MKIILGEEYSDYDSALQICKLDTLKVRRDARSLAFALKTVQHPSVNRMFPLNIQTSDNIHHLRTRERFVVNQARTERYRVSTIPDCQRRLNEYFGKVKSWCDFKFISQLTLIIIVNDNQDLGLLQYQ